MRYVMIWHCRARVAHKIARRAALTQRDGNFIKHGRIGLVTPPSLRPPVFNLTDHLPQPLVIIHREPDAAVVAVLNR